jgi:vancomycin permeability regulator SanA
VTRPQPRTRRGRWLLRSGLLVAGVGLAGVGALVGSIGYVRRTASGHLSAEGDVPSAPVALVLGAQVDPDGTPSPFLAGRLELAKRLYDAGKVQVIVVSGDNMAPEYNEPDAMRAYLLAAGIPAGQVVADYAGFDTYDSCVRAQQIFGIADLVVVTQSYHLPRAVATCLALGLQANGVGDDSARQYTAAWRRGAIRDQLACVKTVIDLVTGREPVLGPRETSVDEALTR